MLKLFIEDGVGGAGSLLEKKEVTVCYLGTTMTLSNFCNGGGGGGGETSYVTFFFRWLFSLSQNLCQVGKPDDVTTW